MSLEILIVDDEHDIAKMLSETLEDEGYKTRCAHDGHSDIDAVLQRSPSIVILDIWLGDSRFDGIRVLDEIMSHNPCVPVIMMSGHGTIETAVNAIKSGAYDFIEKPFKIDRLLIAVERAIEVLNLKKENNALKGKVSAEEALSKEDDIFPQNVLSVIKKISGSNGRILISGPVGSGKEMLARRIHGASLRSDHSFTVVHCMSNDQQGLMNEIFGTAEKNIHSKKVGLLEASHMGT
ncbi:MAG: sigma-54-dependent transcriptional regulator, partial [Bacteroidota bacterium]